MCVPLPLNLFSPVFASLTGQLLSLLFIDVLSQFFSFLIFTFALRSLLTLLIFQATDIRLHRGQNKSIFWRSIHKPAYIQPIHLHLSIIPTIFQLQPIQLLCL